MDEIQISKSKSISFDEYLYDIINNTTSSFANGWGFFVSIDEEHNKTSKTNQTIVRKNSIKSFPSISNLQSPNLLTIDEISETIFEMDLSDIDKKYNYNYNLPTSIYNNIKTNIYFIGTVILYGSIACIKTALDIYS
jgi:hypothetical protein